MSGAFALFLLLQGTSTAPVVINEFAYDDSGTDSVEYVELYNRSGAAVDISGWVLDSADPIGPNAAFTVPAATILAAGDYYVFGSGLVPNVDQVTGVSNIWENDNESLTLRDATSAVVDTLIYEANKGLFNPALAEGPGIFGNYILTEPAVPFARLSVSRIVDGYDTNNNGRDFAEMPSTPGTSNNLPSILPYADDYDAAGVGSEPVEWSGSFVNPRVIDPTLADLNNPNAIPVSPQGGNALICWDPAGGGNGMLLNTTPTDRIDFECLVFVEGANVPGGSLEYETWSIGIQGTTDGFGNHPDPGGLLALNGITGLAEADTGVAWTLVVATDPGGANAAVLYLVDENDGGTDNIVLGSIPITVGANDGWQRIRLRVNGSRVDGWYGGPLGTTEGVHISGTASMPGPGTVYLQYREFLTTNSTARPLTIDAVTVRAAEAGVDFVTPPTHCFASGGCAPAIDWTGGDASVSAAGPFSIDVSRAMSPSAALLVLGFSNGVPFPLNLGLLFPPSTAPCFLLQDFPIVLSLGTSGGGACVGTASVVFPSLAGAAVGGTIYVQYGIVDFAAPIGVPIAMSDGLAVTIQP